MGLKTLARSATYWLTLSQDVLRTQCCSISAKRLTAMAQAALFMASSRCRTSSGRSSTSASGGPRFLLGPPSLSCTALERVSCH